AREDRLRRAKRPVPHPSPYHPAHGRAHRAHAARRDLRPACGTAGFLVAAGDYLRYRHPEILRDARLKKHFHEDAFHGFDFGNTMLRIGSMNMLLHGVENPALAQLDSLTQSLFLDLFGDPATKGWAMTTIADVVNESEGG